MECKLLPKINYREIKSLLATQKEALLVAVSKKSNFRVVYPGIPLVDGEFAPQEIEKIPGVLEAGWSRSMLSMMNSRDRPKKSSLYDMMSSLLTDIQVTIDINALILPTNP